MVQQKLIDANLVMGALLKKKSSVADERYTDGYNDALMRFRSMLHGAPSVDAVSVVRCGESVRGAIPCTARCEKIRPDTL